MQRLTMLAAGNNKNRNSVKQRPQEEKVEEEEEAAAAKPPGDDNGSKGDNGGALGELREEDEVLQADAETTETRLANATKVGEDQKGEEGTSSNGPLEAEADQVEGLTQRVCP